MATLIDNTIVVHPKTGEPTLLAATGELPDWAVGLVGDHLLTGDKPASKADADELTRLRARVAELEAATDRPDSDPDADRVEVEKPGRSASRDEWVAYAHTQDAPEAELAAREQGGLSRDELRDKYGA